MNGTLATAIVRAFHRVAVPLAVYYAVTLGIPLADGAARSDSSFARHALVVLAVPLILVVLWSVVGPGYLALDRRIRCHSCRDGPHDHRSGRV